MNNNNKNSNRNNNMNDDQFFPPNPTQKAVAILIPSNKGILSVSRRNRPDQLALPGGKCHKNEGFRQAAQRELREETGIDLPLSAFEPVYLSQCGKFEVMSYYVRYDGFDIPALSAPVEKGIHVSWATKEQLSNGPFGEYNRELLY